MSAKKGAETSSVVVGGAKKNHVGPQARLTLLVVGAVVVVAAVAYGGWAAYQHFGPNSKTQIAKDAIKKQTVQQTQKSASVKAFSGDTDGAISDLETKLSYTTDKAERANIYNQIALIYAGKKQVDKAVAASEQATKEDPSYVRYATTALIYENAGNKAKAAEYYQKAVDAYNPNDKLNQSLYPKGVNPDIQQYKAKIKELQGA